jgi:hypothetical protein
VNPSSSIRTNGKKLLKKISSVPIRCPEILLGKIPAKLFDNAKAPDFVPPERLATPCSNAINVLEALSKVLICHNVFITSRVIRRYTGRQTADRSIVIGAKKNGESTVMIPRLVPGSKQNTM